MMALLRDHWLEATGPYRKYADFSGRARRREYFLFIALQWLVIAALVTLHSVATGGAPLPRPESGWRGGLAGQLTAVAMALFVLASLVPWLALSTRRLHDRGYRGWVMARWFLPYLGLLFMAWDLLRPGDKGDNAFGPDPRGGMYDDWFE